jgi:hypothetical protein
MISRATLSSIGRASVSKTSSARSTARLKDYARLPLSTKYFDAHDILLTFEGSGRWPDDLGPARSSHDLEGDVVVDWSRIGVKDKLGSQHCPRRLEARGAGRSARRGGRHGGLWHPARPLPATVRARTEAPYGEVGSRKTEATSSSICSVAKCAESRCADSHRRSRTARAMEVARRARARPDLHVHGRDHVWSTRRSWRGRIEKDGSD